MSKRTEKSVTNIRPDEMEAFLKERGWSQWYNARYWVHPKVVALPKAQDYAAYGLSLQVAYLAEVLHLWPIAPAGYPQLGYLAVDDAAPGRSCGCTSGR